MKKSLMSVALLAGLLAIMAVRPGSAHRSDAYSIAETASVHFADWMGDLPDIMLLSYMSIPGTHDSGTYEGCGGHIAQTQNLPISEQLLAGIRMFDIRLGTGCGRDGFTIYHGSQCQHVGFVTDVLEPIEAFLTAHPTEAVLMRIKKEHGDLTNEEFIAQLESELTPYASLLYKTANDNPSLGEMRGKIFLFDDHPSTLPATLAHERDWCSQDNADAYCSDPATEIQDVYSQATLWHLADKWGVVEAQLNDAADRWFSDAHTLYINFLSASLGSFPYFFASGHSSIEEGAPRLLTGMTRGTIDTCDGSARCIPEYPSVNCFLGTCSVAFEGINIMFHEALYADIKRTGIVLADFPGSALIGAIIYANSRFYGTGVLNQPPALSLTSGPATVSENGTVTVKGTITDPDAADAFLLTIDWGEFCGAIDQECPPEAFELPAGTTAFNKSHKYLDDDPTDTASDTHTIIVNVSDSEGAPAEEAQVSVTVNNEGPQLSLAGSTVDEGDGSTLTGLIIDPGTRDTFTIGIAWGDTLSALLFDQSGGEFATTHLYPDDNTFDVRVGVSDDDGGVITKSTPITVRNVAPTVTATGSTVDEGTQATVTGTIADPGVFDDGTLTIHWGDGSTNSYPYVPGGGPFTRDHRYADDGTYQATMNAEDKDGGISQSVTTTVTVRNVAPAVTASDSSGYEGSPSSVPVTIFDPGQQDTFALTVNWGDNRTSSYFLGPGTTRGGVSDGNGGLIFTASHVYGVEGTYQVTATVDDDDGGRGSTTTQMMVINAAPVVTTLGSTTIEGALATVSGTIADPGSNDNGTLTITWGDGTATTQPYAAGAAAYTATHRYLDDNAADAYMVTVLAVDRDGTASDPASAAVTVINSNPTVTASSTDVAENGIATITGDIRDAGVLDSFTLIVQWGDGATNTYTYPAGSTAYAIEHQYVDDNPTGTSTDTYPVVIMIGDDDGGAAGASATVTVHNQPPVIASVLVRDETGATIETDGALALTGLPIGLEASFSDIGPQDTHTALVAWGDGTSSVAAVSGGAGSGTATAGHTFLQPGSVTVALTITDDDTLHGEHEMTINVLSPSGAVQMLGQEVAALLAEPTLDMFTRQALTQVLGEIAGQAGEAAANGAWNLLAKGNYVAALVTLDRALQQVEALLANGSLTAAQRTLLEQLANGLVLSAKSTYIGLVQVADASELIPGAADPLGEAETLSQLADVAFAAGDRLTAMSFWSEAVRLIAHVV